MKRHRETKEGTAFKNPPGAEAGDVKAAILQSASGRASGGCLLIIY